MDISNYAATGGVSTALIASLYLLYKVCYRRKFHSKCCGAEMDVSGGGEPSPTKALDIPKIEIPDASKS
jgi:hypothetical protein